LNRVDVDFEKVLPFAAANATLSLARAGAFASAGQLGKSAAPCTLSLGETFSDFLGSCVRVTGVPSTDDDNYDKLLGGLVQKGGEFQFDVVGARLDFKAAGTPGAVPQAADVANALHVSIGGAGQIVNDHEGNDPSKARDLHGAGLVYLEYARLVQDALSASLPASSRHALGDPACLAGPAGTVDPKTYVYPAGCTGFEAFVSAAPTQDPAFARNALPASTILANGFLSSLFTGLRPGTPYVVFCSDATGASKAEMGYQVCDADDPTHPNTTPPPVARPAEAPGAQGPLFTTSLARVVAVLGKGNATALPADAQQVDFYFQKYATALVKYLLVAGTPDETVDGVHAAPFDAAKLTITSVGVRQFFTADYVDERFVAAGGLRTTLTLTADVVDGIVDGYTFAR
jgi:hypothetical protein